MIKRLIICLIKGLLGKTLLLLAAFAMPVLAQDSATVKMRVELEPGIGGATGVTYKLYRVQGCCEECLKVGNTSCRKCGCPIAGATDQEVTLQTSGVVEFKNLSSGTYRIENEIGGKSAGYEATIEVKKNKTTDLGPFIVDSGKPFFNYYENRQDGAALSDSYRSVAKASDDIAAALNTMTKVKRELGTSGKLPRDREIALTILLQKANNAHRAFLNEIKELKADPNPAAKATLCSLFAAATSALTDLNNNGISPVEDADAKSKLTTVFSTIVAASAIIAGAGLC
jgi:hypothetical protein